MLEAGSEQVGNTLEDCWERKWSILEIGAKPSRSRLWPCHVHSCSRLGLYVVGLEIIGNYWNCWEDVINIFCEGCQQAWQILGAGLNSL